MIVFDNVTKYYKSNVGLEKVSVHINKGDFVFLVGPSGAGKSTFIKLILKEIDATSGSIKVRGREVTTMSNRQVPILRRNIGIVFQDFRLLPKKTVYENVAFAKDCFFSDHNVSDCGRSDGSETASGGYRAEDPVLKKTTSQNLHPYSIKCLSFYGNSLQNVEK